MPRLPVSPATPGRPGFAFAAFAAGLAAAGSWLWLGEDLSWATALSLALIAGGVLHLFNGCLSGRTGPMMLTFWPFVIVTMGIAPLAQDSLGMYPKLDGGLARYYDDAMALTVAVCFAYVLGYARGWRQQDDDSTEAETPGEAAPVTLTRDGGRRLLFAVLLALAAFPLSIASGVSIGSRFQSRDDLIQSYAAAGLAYVQGDSITLALFKTLPTVLAIVGLTLAAHEYVRRRRADLPRANAGLVLLVAGASFAVFANPLSNSRFIAFAGALSVLFAVLRLRTWATRVGLATALVLGLTAIYPAAAAFKNDDIARSLATGTDAFTTVDFDSMQQTANGFAYVETRGHTEGLITLSGALFFVPRAIWEDKSLPSSFLTTEARGYVARNLSQPIWSELYLDFGWVGAILSFLGVGLASASLDRRFRQATSVAPTLLVATAAAVQIGFLRGPLGAQIVISAPIVLLTVAAVWFSLRGRGVESVRPFSQVRESRSPARR